MMPYLVPILLHGRLVLQVGASGGQPTGLCVDVQGAMDAVEVAIHILGGHLRALQGQDEIAEEGVNGAHIAERIHCTCIKTVRTIVKSCRQRSVLAEVN